MTREDWLNAAITVLKDDFKNSSCPAVIPDKTRVTCGWPSRSGRAKKKPVVGEVWPPKCSEDGYTEIFINPTVGDSLKVLGILVHELVHAAVGCEEGHRGRFRTTAISLGLEGKMTTTSVGETLSARLREIAEELGKYPHSKITPKNMKKQSTRMLKLLCPSCGYLARTSQKWIDLGTPTCACGIKMEAV